MNEEPSLMECSEKPAFLFFFFGKDVPTTQKVCYNTVAGRAVAASSEGEESLGSLGHDDG